MRGACQDDKCVIQDEYGGTNISRTAISFATVKTDLGQTKRLVVEKLLEEVPTSVCKLLLKIVEAMMLKGTPPFEIPPSTHHLEHLDSIVQCVPSLEGKSLSTILKQILEGVGYADDGNFEDHIQQQIMEANNMVQAATEFLTSGWRPDSTESNVIIHDYESVLRLACKEVFQWFNSNPTTVEIESSTSEPSNVKTNISEATSLEQELLKQVGESTWEFKEIMNNADCIKDHPKLKSLFLQKPSLWTKMRKWIEVVLDTISIYKEVVWGIRFWAILGPENVGKSTFIKKVLEKYDGRQHGLPMLDVHTSKATLYKVNNSLYLVDVPAEVDMEDQLVALPTSFVLLLDFSVCPCPPFTNRTG